MEINLKDLVKKVLLQWRLLLIGVLVLAVALTVFGGVRSKKAAAEAQEKLDQQIATGVPEADRVVVPKVTLVSPKMLLLGAALGFCSAAGVVCVQYVLTGKLRCESDLAEGYSVSVLGKVAVAKKKRLFGVVDRFIARLFGGRAVSHETKIGLIATDIAMAAKAKGATSLYFTGNGYASIADEVAEALKGSDVKISSGELAIYSPELLKEMLSSDGIVLFERLEHSSFADIKKELTYSERYSIPVIGCVVVE